MKTQTKSRSPRGSPGMQNAIRLLIVEDSDDDAQIAVQMLRRGGFDVRHERVETAAAFAAALRSQPWDAVLSDFHLPGFSGMEALKIVRAAHPDMPFILMSGKAGEEIAVDAMRAGADDYLVKDNLARLASVLERTLEATAIRAAHRQAQRDLVESEARFRTLTKLSSDFFWETDAQHRFRAMEYEGPFMGPMSSSAYIGKTRWEVPHVSPDAEGWQRHREVLAARQPIRGFAFARRSEDGEIRHYEVSGDPVFDPAGAFTGYRGVGSDITERKVAEAALRDSLAMFRSLTATAIDAIITADENGNIVEWNPAAESMFGYTRAEAVGQALTLIIPERDRSAHLIGLKRVVDGGEQHAIGRRIERSGLTKAGVEIPLEMSVSSWQTAKGRMFAGILHSIAERKLLDAKVRRQTQLYAALSECNKAIVHCANKEELFSNICRSAVRFGGMTMAWIGLVDPETGLIRIAASHGERADAYLEGVQISVDARSPLGQGPSGIAVRENRAVWSEDFKSSPVTAPWHERRAAFGWGASACLPLRMAGTPIGVFAFYATEASAFDESARDLLVEMATDIGFALENFDRESRRKRATRELEAAEGRFRGLVEQAIAGIYIIQHGQLVYANPRCAEIIGHGSADDLIGTEPFVWIIEADRAKVAESLRQLLSGEAKSLALEFGVRHRDGSTVQVGAHAAAATHDGQPAVIGLLQDISEKKRAEEEIRRYVNKVEAALMSTVEVATAMSEMRDPYTAGHQRRVAEIAVAIGAELGFDARRQEGLRVAGNLHDIGKFNIPSEILSKPGKLSPIEFQLVQSHARAGFDVLKSVQFPWPVAEVALQHHERLDGSGYPQGLRGEAILLEARIMAVADIVEAMSSHRPYRAGLGLAAALAQLEQEAGSKLDAGVVAACERLFRKKGFQLPA